jgi:modulator of FtsH protease HflK
MRERGLPSEVRRLAEPVTRLLDGAWQRMHWWIALMAASYALSGITVVKPDEVAVILRWGRLVGEVPALQEHGAGLLFAFPRPMDEVVRVPVKHVWEVTVNTLDSEGHPWDAYGSALDPVKQGYALTGDQNIVHVAMVARYRVRDAAEWAFQGPKAERVLLTEVTAAMVRSLGEMKVDQVLADGRKKLITTVTRRAQSGLDASHSGIELSSLELTRLGPPRALAPEFDAVQSAFIGAQTKQNEAQGFAQSVIPQAQAEADAAVQNARGTAEGDLASARGEAESFLVLNREYRRNPEVVRERLYRDAVDRAIAGAAEVQWIPPPVGGSYHGFRITVNPSDEPKEITDSISEGAPSSSPPAPLPLSAVGGETDE